MARCQLCIFLNFYNLQFAESRSANTLDMEDEGCSSAAAMFSCARKFEHPVGGGRACDKTVPQIASGQQQ